MGVGLGALQAIVAHRKYQISNVPLKNTSTIKIYPLKNTASLPVDLQSEYPPGDLLAYWGSRLFIIAHVIGKFLSVNELFGFFRFFILYSKLLEFKKFTLK